MSLSSVDDRQIVVTGAGLWTPLADRCEASWSGIVSGARSARWLDDSDGGFAETTPKGNPPLRWAGAPAARRPGRNVAATMALATVKESLAVARFDSTDFARLRIGCVFGTSKGSFEILRDSQALSKAGLDGGENPESPTVWRSCLPSGPLEALMRAYPSIEQASCPVAACATGAMAILQGARWIAEGRCDVVIAGSVDSALQPALLASYRKLGVLARVEADPATACRPFDRDRSGFIVGEGGGAVVLERLSTARSRGAAPLAHWCGGINLCDSAGLLRGDGTGQTLAEAIGRLLKMTRTSPHEIDLVGLHGTGTIENDLAEGRGVRAALGESLRPAAFSLKGAIGHLLGGAGSVETIAGLLALRDQVVPPTVNLASPDPDCLPDSVSAVSRRRSLKNFLKLSLGFGGHIVALQFRR